ncbi:hypothetical protein U3516DRAFT_785417 [Neocallimastix sp. 'constans']|jgi:hypothetical protein
MDSDSQELFDENLDTEEDIIENNENRNNQIGEDIVWDESINDDANENKDDNINESINEKINENTNENINGNIDENITEKNNFIENKSTKNIENINISQSLSLKSDSNLNNNNDIENNNNKSKDSIGSNSYILKNGYNGISDVEKGKIDMEQIDKDSNKFMNSIDQLKDSEQSLQSNSFSSNSDISLSNNEIYMNITQRKSLFGNGNLNINNNSETGKSTDLPDLDTSPNIVKKDKINYIESNMMNNEPSNLLDLSLDEMKKKSDEWLNPVYLNNEKYKKNLEVDMNNLSIQILAQEFLTNDNVDLETRAYLLESVFPILCVSLEKLLIEIDRRKIIEMDEKPSEFIVERSHNAIPKDVPFDSINWLAQYLYRNNPKYSNYSDITSTPYLKSIKSVMTTLKAKLYEMDINKKALERADELARKREEERQQKIREALYIEKKKTYTNLLKSLYDQWVDKLWRKENNIYLTNFEIIDCLKSIESSYQSKDDTDYMKESLMKLIENINEEFNKLIQIQINEEGEKGGEEINVEEVKYLNDIEQENIENINEMLTETYMSENHDNNDDSNDKNNNDDTNNDDLNNGNINNIDSNNNENNEKHNGIETKERNDNKMDESINYEMDSKNRDSNEYPNNKDALNEDLDNENEKDLDNINNIDNEIKTKLNENISDQEIHISQDKFIDIILNEIIEWKIEEVSSLISLINENVKLEESEMFRIFEIIFKLPGILLLGNEWKKFIEINSEKLEMPQVFVDDIKKSEDPLNSGENDTTELINENQVEEFSKENLEEGTKHEIDEIKILELKRNIKVNNDVCTIVISDHPDEPLIKENNENTIDDNDGQIAKESMNITPRFIKYVSDIIEFFKNNPLTKIPEDIYGIESIENLGFSNFQLFVRNLMSTYTPKSVLFIMYQINCLKLMEIEEAKKEEIKRKEEEILQNRIKKIKLIYNFVDTESSGNVLVKQLNTVFENVPVSVGDMEFLKYPLEVQDMFVYLKIPVMARALLTKTITEQEFIDHFLNVCASLIPEHFDIVLQLIMDSLGIALGKEDEEKEAENKDKCEELTLRENDQNEVIKMIWKSIKDPEADISQICDLGLTLTVDTLIKYNTTGQLVGDIVVNESVVDFTGHNKDGENNNNSTQLVYISADNTGKDYKENVDKQFSILNNPASSLLEAFKNNKVKITNCNESLSEDEKVLKDSLILNVPLNGKDTKSPIGVLSLKLQPKIKDNNEEKSEITNTVLEFSDDDVNFVKDVGKTLGYAVEHISHRERSNAILESCSTYIHDLIKNNNVNLYLVEKVPSRTAIENICKKKNKEASTENDFDSDQSFSKEDYTYVMYISDKPTMEEKIKISQKNETKKTKEENNKNKVKFQKSEKDNILKKVSKKDKNSNVLMESVNTNTVVTRHDSETAEETITAIPIVDQMKQCIGMISMNSKLAENDPSFIEDINELKHVSTLIADAMTLADQENIKSDKPLLYAETISEQLRRKLFFPKLLLLKARENLSKIDANSIAELKSYRVPPTIIHKVICCILFIFGYTPKQVESWQDAARYINQDLLHRMQQYDSTTKQKSSIFKRIKSIIKNYIKTNDIKNQSSLPAQCMYDWLLVSLTLRSIAIRNRKAQRKENVFTSSDKEEKEEEEEEEEEAIFDDEGDEEETLNYILSRHDNSRNVKSLFNISIKNDFNYSLKNESKVHHSLSLSKFD